MADTHDCQSEHSPNTWEHFLTVLDKEFKNSRQAAPKIVDKLRFTDLNYSVRVAAVLRVTRDVGVMLNKEDFNHVVVGRLTVRGAFDFIAKRVDAVRSSEAVEKYESGLDRFMKNPSDDYAAFISLGNNVRPVIPPSIIYDPAASIEPFKF